jgi:hypothetical protein
MMFMLIEQTVDEEVLDRFNCDSLTIWANWGIGFANAKEGLI